MELAGHYNNAFGSDPEADSFCPYRVCPLGAHIDHQHGHINGLALDRGIHFMYGRTESGECDLRSMQFTGMRAVFNVNAVPAQKAGDWADYLRGAARKLAEKHVLSRGVKGIFEGSMPIGGLSSSAAVTIAFLSALCAVNGIKLTEWELIMTAKLAENEYVGVNCGKLDQACEVLCRKNSLLYLDTLDDSYEIVPQPENMPEYRIAVFFSGLEHALAGSKYNSRRDECVAASYALKAYAGLDYDGLGETFLRDVPPEVFSAYGERLPEAWRKRAEHFFSEDARAVKGAELWKQGKLAEYGKLINQSGHSSIYSYESGSDELKKLYEIMLETDGIYGGRFSGAGFKGCCMAIIDPAFEEAICEKVTREYTAAFPKLADKYKYYICESADGVKL